MKWIAILCAAFTAAGPFAAQAAPLSPADAARLEGLWQVNGSGNPDACGRNGDWLYGIKMTMEFRLTGGQISFDDGAEGAGPQRIVKAEKTGNDTVLRLRDDDTPFRMTPVGKDGLKVLTSGAEGFIGKTFRQCTAGEARTGITLDRADMTFLAGTMLPELPRFVDARVKGGCKAAQYQYLNFDLADPVQPEIRREDNDALGVARFKKRVTVPVDDDGMGRWIIEAATRTAAGYDFTVIELIPPNGSRGDKTKLSALRTKDGISIPAWKRSYVRCKQED